MTKEQINELLANIISSHASPSGRAASKKTALKLTMSAIECQIENTVGDTYTLMKTALSECGTILEENVEYGMISGIILSGFANMNPAFLQFWIEGTSIHLVANAKEGLIKQHTAEGAIETFKSALANAKVSYITSNLPGSHP